MTPEQRATKALREWFGPRHTLLRESIAIQIREAIMECAAICEECHKRGENAGVVRNDILSLLSKN